MPQRREPPDADDAAGGTEGEDGEGPAPADLAGQGRDELDRDGGEEEAGRGLDGEGGAYRVRRDGLGDQGAELGAVGDDEEAPGPGEEGDEGQVGSEEEADGQGAGAAGGQGDGDQALAAGAVGDEASPDAAGAADGDGAEGGEGDGGRGVAAAGRCAGRQEGGDPGPEGVELEHVTEVTAGGEAEGADADDLGGEAPGEGPGWEWVGAVAVAGQDEQGGGEGAAGGGEDDPGDPGTPQGMYQVGGRLAHGERTDHGPNRQASAGAEPGGDHLHRRRVDAGEEEAGREAARQGRPVPGGEEERAVGQRAEGRRDGEQQARRHDVGEVEERGAGGAGDEAELDDGGEPGGLRGAQAPARGELGRDGAGREPQRHPEQLGGGEQAEHAPARGMRVGLA